MNNKFIIRFLEYKIHSIVWNLNWIAVSLQKFFVYYLPYKDSSFSIDIVLKFGQIDREY